MSDLSVHVRRAEPADLDELCRLVGAFREEDRPGGPSDDALREGLRRVLGSADADFLLSFDADGRATGYVQQRYWFSAWLGAEGATLEDLFVSPGGRRQGVATTLMGAAMAAAEARGCRAVKLDTNEANVNAVRLYERLGFVSGLERFPGTRQLSFEKSLPA